MAKAAARRPTYDNSLFINCPFDTEYKPIFEALVFAAFDCGYVPRCSMEADDAGQVRVEKILSIIRACRLGVHDISRTELDVTNGLPRFNMPFELGLFVGAARLGAHEQRKKVSLVLDRERYRFQKFISDIAGQDIREDGDDPERAIAQLRGWLATQPRKDILPGGTGIAARYRAFRAELPAILTRMGVDPNEMVFADYANIVFGWLSDWPRAGKSPIPRSRKPVAADRRRR